MSRPRRPSYAYQINRFINRFPELCCDGPVIKCRVCEIFMLGWSPSQCKRHIASQTHQRNRLLQLPYWVFLSDLLFMLSVCNIPYRVVDNEHFRLFWKKYVPQWSLPQSRRTYRRLRHVKQETEKNMRSDLSGKKLWVAVDETTDMKNNKVGHVLVRILSPDKANKPYLLASKRLLKNNAESVQQLVVQALEKFCIKKDNVVMLVTHGAAYMVKTAVLLKNVYPNLLHVTCMIHLFQRVAETIRNNYPTVDKLISNTAKVFSKSPKRIKEFHNSCPGIADPPQPVLTKWETWLKACFYYNKHFQTLKPLISKFNPSESVAIRECQQIYGNPEVEENLRNIEDNYSALVNAINQLQNGSMSLDQSFQIIYNVQVKLQSLIDAPGVETTKVFNNLLNNNPDFGKLHTIWQCLTQGYTDELYQFYKYANITSLDVKSSFSKYDALYNDKRTAFNESNVEAILMIQTYAGVHLPLGR